MFQLLMKKMFLFSPTVYLFGAEIDITEMRQIFKKTGPAVSRNEV
jgi:hypothetical protein